MLKKIKENTLFKFFFDNFDIKDTKIVFKHFANYYEIIYFKNTLVAR